jgi:hypothetical protein
MSECQQSIKDGFVERSGFEEYTGVYPSMDLGGSVQYPSNWSNFLWNVLIYNDAAWQEK